MKFRLLFLSLLLGSAAARLPAAESDVQQLQTQIQELQASMEKTRREQEQQIAELNRKLAALIAANPAPAPAAAPTAPPSPDAQKQLEQQLAAELAPPAGATAAAAEPAPALPPAAVATGAHAGSSYMNLSYGATMFAGSSSEADPSAQLELGDHDPAKRGFSLRNAEIAIDGAVDPYFKGFANIVLKLDKNGETSIELEESFAQTTSLPANLQVKAGQYFAAFGRQNAQHPHTWSFVDQPLILGRAFGPDGLRSLGAQLSWLAPTPFYTEAFLSVMDGQGSTAFSFRNPGEPDTAGVNRYAGRATLDRTLGSAADLLYVPRLASSFELSDTQTLLAGVSAAFGPNSTGPHERTEIYGVDLFWKWKPANAAQGFPFVTWQTEALWRQFSAGADPSAPTPLPAATIRDSGAYTQIVWGFHPRWNAGLRADYVDGNDAATTPDDPYRGLRYRFSPELTFLPSEFSKLRLQYNYDHGDNFGTAHSIWMQLEFGLGAHAAHQY